MHGQSLHNQVLRKETPTLFAGPKCTVAIPLESLLQRDALREASLDPAVCTIHYRAAPNPYGAPPTLMGVVLGRVDGDFLLNVCWVRPHRSSAASSRLAEQLAATGLRLLERDAADIRREPIYSNVHEVWSHEHYPVPIVDRLRIGAALCESGPQTIHELRRRARPDCHLLGAVCALSCEGLLTVDVRERSLGEQTMVRPI
ncbi:hypothetical protein M2175_004025 [Bradyrhizobium elkanii]|uniref:hypothetical protein n=1 Tax=Bradyrhizobium TaxID=374 RepID=UPI0021670402|nr:MULTISPECIES: hypothetical protein [Bradyrhizobium]MCS3928994.1 hypothetical protein [Bradyrhizobium elkanii]MCS3969550.1 hypothetical protein [Bradyrhizobium japonicum]